MRVMAEAVRGLDVRPTLLARADEAIEEGAGPSVHACLLHCTSLLLALKKR
jgi:hypothetical protein